MNSYLRRRCFLLEMDVFCLCYSLPFILYMFDVCRMSLICREYVFRVYFHICMTMFCVCFESVVFNCVLCYKFVDVFVCPLCLEYIRYYFKCHIYQLPLVLSEVCTKKCTAFFFLFYLFFYLFLDKPIALFSEKYQRNFFFL